MRQLLSIAVIVFLACGCSKKSQPTAPEPPPGPALPDAIRLPESSSGKPIDRSVENTIFLHVNSNGEVTPPFDVKPLADLKHLENYLNLQANSENARTGKRPMEIPILRIDRETPFEKVYPIMQVCYSAYYEKYQLRVTQPSTSTETQISLTFGYNYGGAIVCSNEEQPKLYAIKVVTNDAGQITGLNFREYGSPEEEGENLGSDLAACQQKLTRVVEVEMKRIAHAAAKGNKVPPPELRLEIADKLRQQSVVQLLDVGIESGFTDVRLQSTDPAHR